MNLKKQDTENPIDAEQAKWSQWTMRPKKAAPKLTVYASAIVILTAAMHMMSSAGV